MQVLKQEIREKIIRSAKREFKKNGFKKASMREISAHANMTVGNLYRYYKNKEDLYGAIINPLTEELRNLETTPSRKVPELTDLTNEMKELQSKYRSEWVILFNGSSGTRYEKAVKGLEKTLKGSLEKALVHHHKLSELAGPLSVAVINGINVILQKEGKKSPQLTEDFMNYLLGGIKST